MVGSPALSGLTLGCVESGAAGDRRGGRIHRSGLMQLRAAELAPHDYSNFAHQWVTLRARVEAEEDAIRWPWESNELEQALRHLQAEGTRTVARPTEQQDTLRRSAERHLAQVEDRAKLISTEVSAIDSRLVLGEKPVEIDLLIKQSRAYYEQGALRAVTGRLRTCLA